VGRDINWRRGWVLIRGEVDGGLVIVICEFRTCLKEPFGERVYGRGLGGDLLVMRRRSF
jgi:hypothetical protein